MKMALASCVAMTVAAAFPLLGQTTASLSNPEKADLSLVSQASAILADLPLSLPPNAWNATGSSSTGLEEVIPAGVPLRVELDQSYRLRTGTQIQGHLTDPVYLVDHVVLPRNSKVFGTITGKHSLERKKRIAALFNGDLTPLKQAEVAFDSVETPDGHSYNVETNATERTATVMRISERRKSRFSLRSSVSSAVRWARTQTAAAFSTPHKVDKVRQFLYQEIPVHPQEVWAGTQYDAELLRPLAVAAPVDPPRVEFADLTKEKLTGAIEARLIDSVDSSSALPGSRVEAVLTRPLFENDPSDPSAQTEMLTAPATAGAAHTAQPQKRHSAKRLLLPEGTRLIGVVVRAKSAGKLGRNGSLRLSFREAELPQGSERAVHGQITAAEQVKGGGRLSIDDEGGVRVSKSSIRFFEPLALSSFGAMGNSTGARVAKEAMAGNGMDVVSRMVAALFSNGGMVTGLAYYQAGKVIFDQWIARGHDVVFARNTRVEIELAQR